MSRAASSTSSSGEGRRIRGVTAPWGLAVIALASTVAMGCGYRPLYAGGGCQPLTVSLVDAHVPDAATADEVVAGARERLAREGCLGPSAAYPRLEIEVLRLDEVAEGIVATTTSPGGTRQRRGQPEARGRGLSVVARAWLRRAEGAAPERDTGDVRVSTLVAVDRDPSDLSATDPVRAGFAGGDGLRAAGRRLGDRLALHILGYAVPADEAAGVPR